ncbi:GDSL' lipolytic enzym [Ancistrocladus abbreviatus]
MVLVGAGPIGCIPSLLYSSGKNTCVKEVNNLASLFNSRLIQLTSNLNNSLPGSIFIYHNIYDRFYDMVANPSNYGQYEIFSTLVSYVTAAPNPQMLNLFTNPCFGPPLQGSRKLTKHAVGLEEMEGN